MDRSAASVGARDWVARTMPLSGIAAVALQVVAYPMTGSFDYRPSPERAAEIIGSNSSGIALAALLGGFYSILFLLVFASVVAGAIRDVEGRGSLAFVALAGGIVAALALGFGYRFLAAAAHVADGPAGIGPEICETKAPYCGASSARVVPANVWLASSGKVPALQAALTSMVYWSVTFTSQLQSPAVGVTCGFGYYLQAGIAVALAMVVLIAFGFIEARLLNGRDKPAERRQS